MPSPKSQLLLLVAIAALVAGTGLYFHYLPSIRYWLVLRSVNYSLLHTAAVLFVTAAIPPTTAFGMRRIFQLRPPVAVLIATAAGGLAAATSLYPLAGCVWGLAAGIVVCYSTLDVRLLLDRATRLAVACLVGSLGVFVVRRVALDGGALWWICGPLALATIVAQFAVLLSSRKSKSSVVNRVCLSVVVIVAFPAAWISGWRAELSRRIADIRSEAGAVEFGGSSWPRVVEALHDVRPDYVRGREQRLLAELVWGKSARSVTLANASPRHLRTIQQLNGSPQVSLLDGHLDAATQMKLPPGAQRSTTALIENSAKRLTFAGKFAAAAETYERLLETQAQTLGSQHAATYTTKYWLGLLHGRLGNLEAAERHFEDYLTFSRQGKIGYFIAALAGLAEVRLDQHRLADAESLCQEFLSNSSSHSWNHHYGTSLLGECMTLQGKHGEAEPLLTVSFEALAGSSGKNLAPWFLPGEAERAGERVVFLYESWNRPDEAAQWRQRVEKYRDRD